MKLTKLVCILAVIFLVQSFPKNCLVFNPNNYNQCYLCQKTYYLEKGGCLACPMTNNSIKQCSTVENSQIDQAKVLNQTTTPPPTTTTSLTNTSANKAQSILATAFGKTSGIVIINATNPANNPSTPLTVNNSSTPSNNNSSASSNPSSTSTASQNSTSIASDMSIQASATNKTSNHSNSVQNNLSSSASASSNTSFATPPTSNDITQIVFKYLPAHCCQFTIVPTLACSNCEKDYVLTPNKTCEPVSPSSTSSSPTSASTSTPNSTNQSSSNQDKGQSIPNDLKVSSSLNQISGSSLPIVASIPASSSVSNPQPIFIPIPINTSQTVSNTTPQTQTIPQKSQDESKTTSISTNSSTSQPNTTNSAIMPRNITIVDRNCYEPNPLFSLNKPVSLDNVRCSCYTGFYYDLTKELCLPLNPYCKTATNQNKCTSCYMGYSLIEGNCTLSSSSTTQTSKSASSSTTSSSPIDPNCQSYQQNSNICAVCANRYYFDKAKNLCKQVDSSCQTWNQVNGYCTSCYSGYTSGSTDKSCKPIVPSSSASTKSSCAKYSGNVCTACAYRSILNNGMCFPVSDQCNTFNTKFGYCLSCYSGYQLINGDCEKIQVNNDPNCASSIGIQCQQCISGYFVNSSTGICAIVSGLCVGYNPQNGYCLDCVYPYTLNQLNGQCIYNP